MRGALSKLVTNIRKMACRHDGHRDRKFAAKTDGSDYQRRMSCAIDTAYRGDADMKPVLI